MDIQSRQPQQFLTKASGYLKDYTHTLNPYMGCQFACTYCYVRRSPISLFSGKTWGDWVTAKTDEQLKFRKELQKNKAKGPFTVFMSSSTDPYQPLEKKYEMTRYLLSEMHDCPPDFLFIQTRSPLIQRDIDILQSYPGNFIVSMTVESDREDIIRHFTPKTPSIQSRLKTVDKLRAAHIPTQIAVAPVLPCTNQFGERLAKHVDRVTIDDYFMGDGSNGRRTQSLGIQSLYEDFDLQSWYHPDTYLHVLKLIQDAFPHDNIAISSNGFVPFQSN
ncbi:radical SAM protein [Staphylococcus pseudintermedius]|uniref:SPL family radical SAM protein n=1 Tax=Staphylococcus pseudintermedius TaxID=283734 RepID=UPI00111D7F89|nr:radical SAM protein [Staphylococcus pseudintermedius]TOZ19607.1 radical SAM protein [Staphylococcus pseudintermedius]